MSDKDRWLLPEGVEELLPAEAWRQEQLRRRVLDLFDSWGYELVVPPMVEYLDALLTGVGEVLDLQTFKLTDQLSGRLMGIRPDITPQAARIDAHYLKRNHAVRLCYLGPVLRTRPDAFGGSREPLQLGAELFGHQGAESDAEVLSLMLTTLTLVGIRDIHLDLGHVGVFRGLSTAAGLSAVQENILFEALQRKARPEVEAMLSEWEMPDSSRQHLLALLALNGGSEVLDRAEALYATAPPAVRQAIAELQAVAKLAAAKHPGLPLYFDFSELSGYGYYTGVIFSAFVPGLGRAVGNGGRYDGIGQAFGRARPATGFGADLRLLLKLVNDAMVARQGIMAPYDDDPSLQALIRELREGGERVVVCLPGDSAQPAELGCDRALQKQGGAWAVNKI